jgi:hypothetical protein
VSEPALRTVADHTEAELRAWAEAMAPTGSPQAWWVLRLLDAVAVLKGMNVRLAARVAEQSDLLARRAERAALGEGEGGVE